MREVIHGIKHPAYRDTLALTRAGGREATGRYLVEDADMVRQALACPQAEIVAIFTTPDEGARFDHDCEARGIPLYILGGGLITKLIGTSYETSAAAVAVVVQRTVPPEALFDDPSALILCCEHIQDPRNIGVLIRTAEAAGCAGLLMSSDCAEPFSRQAVRSTTGSILRIKISIAADLPKTLARLRERGVPVIATSARAQNVAYDANLARRPLILAVGNETKGISAPLREAATDFVSLPMAPDGASSLNVTVAAGVLLYESIRQKRAES